MGGERIEQVSVGANGIAGDRAWGVRDVETGMILTGRREPRLLLASAWLPNGRPVIRLDDGREVETSDELSAWLDRPVELVAPGDTPATYEDPRDVERETDWVAWEGPSGSFHDGASVVSMVSTRSLADYDRRRFRQNLILDGADRELDECTLVGHDATVGSVGLHVRKPIDRCIMVTRAQPGLPADLGVLKRLIRERDNLMGVGAEVYRDGTLRVGDALHPVPD